MVRNEKEVKLPVHLLSLVSQGKPEQLLSKEITPIYKYACLPLGRNRLYNHGILLVASGINITGIILKDCMITAFFQKPYKLKQQPTAADIE